MEWLQHFESRWIGRPVQLTDGRDAFIVSVGQDWIIISDGATVGRMPRKEFDKLMYSTAVERPAAEPADEGSARDE